MEPNDVKKVRKFLEVSCPVTRNEIASGTGLSRDEVAGILAVLVPTGEIIRGGAPEDNYATYTLPGKPAPVVSTEPYVSAEAKWSAAARVAALARYKREHPEETVAPPKAFEPSDAEVQAQIDANAAKTFKPLTPEQQKWLEYTRLLKPANPQAFLR